MVSTVPEQNKYRRAAAGVAAVDGCVSLGESPWRRALQKVLKQ